MLADENATPHALMNEATEWLQYSRGLSQLLSELVHEADAVDCAKMGLALEAIAALTRAGIQCATQAHSLMHEQELGRWSRGVEEPIEGCR